MMGPDDVALKVETIVGSETTVKVCLTSDEAIRAAFSLKTGSERRSFSEVSVVTTVEDDSQLLVSSVASLLELYATQSKEQTEEQSTHQITAWDSPFLPKFSVHEFLDSLMRNFRLSPECCAVAFIYVDRFTRMHPEFSITFTNVHRLLLSSVVVAAKYFEDVRYSNASFANFFGLGAKQMASMELYLVRGLDWDLYVSQQQCEECQVLMMEWGDQMPQPVKPRRQRGSTSKERAPRPRRTIRRF